MAKIPECVESVLRDENTSVAQLLDIADLARRIADDRRSGSMFELNVDEIDMIRSNRKIDAMRSYRDRTGVSLATAKHICDQIPIGR